MEKIKGEDKNLVITDQLADGTKYTLTIYGKDVKEAADFNTAIQKTSKYEKEIQMLAPEPDIFVLEQEGEYPGEVLVQIETKKQMECIYSSAMMKKHRRQFMCKK